MKKIIAALTLAAMASSASAFFSDDDNYHGYGTGGADGKMDSRGRGAGKGTGDMEGDFSMTLNASGKGHADMDADTDFSNDTRMDGDTDWRSESRPYYYGQPYGRHPYYAAPRYYRGASAQKAAESAEK